MIYVAFGLWASACSLIAAFYLSLKELHGHQATVSSPQGTDTAEGYEAYDAEAHIETLILTYGGTYTQDVQCANVERCQRRPENCPIWQIWHR